MHDIETKQKCHYMCIGTNTENDKSAFDNLFFENSKEEVLLGITVDNKLTFNSHIKNICFKKGQKLGELLRITDYLNSRNLKKLHLV